ncbi:MAG: hypothetical protein LBQ40_02830 [Clostridiales bacterium]|jgi:hypothetical protein|nr:hypothetical protein [Clostridiales bacterium]
MIIIKNLLNKIKYFYIGNRLAAILVAACFVLLTAGVTVGVTLGTKHELTGIEVAQMPSKTEYVEAQTLDTDGKKRRLSRKTKSASRARRT